MAVPRPGWSCASNVVRGNRLVELCGSPVPVLPGGCSPPVERGVAPRRAGLRRREPGENRFASRATSGTYDLLQTSRVGAWVAVCALPDHPAPLGGAVSVAVARSLRALRSWSSLRSGRRLRRSLSRRRLEALPAAPARPGGDSCADRCALPPAGRSSAWSCPAGTDLVRLPGRLESPPQSKSLRRLLRTASGARSAARRRLARSLGRRVVTKRRTAVKYRASGVLLAEWSRWPARVPLFSPLAGFNRVIGSMASQAGRGQVRRS